MVIGSVMAVAFLIMCSLTSVGGFIMLGTLVLTFVPGMFIVAAVVTRLEQRWRDSQPDSAAWGQYGSATWEWEKAHEAWLKTQQSWWNSLHPADFEVQVANNLKDRGYEVQWTGRAGDGGVDIRATAPGGIRIVVQCKAYQEPVGPASVRELYGTLMHEGAQEGWLVALAGFSGAAKEFAVGKPLRLLDMDTLIRHSGHF